MPTLTFTDEQGTELVSTALGSKKGLGRYLEALTVFRAGRRLVKSATQPISVVAAGERTLDFALSKDLAIGGGQLTLEASASGAVGVYPAGEALFSADDLRDAVTVPNGTTCLSLSLGAQLGAGVGGGVGALAFGFHAGASLGYRYFQPFDNAAGDPLFKDALRMLIGSAVVPGDVDDLQAMDTGAYAVLTGAGELQVSGQVTYSAVTNVLATPGLPVVGAAKLAAAAQASIGAEWRVSGELELRLAKTADGRVRLEYRKGAGSTLTVEAKASAGISATLKGNDLLKMFFSAISADPEADLLALVNAGLDDQQILAIQGAIKASIDRSLCLSAELQFSATRQGEALFAYDIDLQALDARGREALADALRGHLSGLERLAAAPGGPVTFVASGFTRLRERRVTWRINLFGVLNVMSISDLIRKGTLSYDPVAGSLNAADQIASQRILVKLHPLASDGDKVRHLLLESLMVTAAYQASRVLSTVTLTAAHSYVEQNGRARRANLLAHYDAIAALGLCDAQERDRRLGTEGDFGASTFMLECRLDSGACDALFLAPDGQGHPVDYYERIAREALLSLLRADDPEGSYRRWPIERDAIWEQMKELGQFNLGRVLPAHIAQSPQRVAVVAGDYSTIVWWSGAMAKAGQALAAMREFLGGRNAASLVDDKAFRNARGRLESALARAVAHTEARWSDPWDIVALDAASGRAGKVQAVIVSPKLAAAYEERPPMVPAARAAAAIGARALAPPVAGAADEARVEFTDGQLDILRRHVVNLRGGKFSSGGVFQTTEADVRRLFTELLPGEIDQARRAGRPVRVLFYAHGGLTDEAGGLRAVLARQRCWRLNGFYPVFFVWETGLRESLLDILGSMVGAAPRELGAPRNALTDAVLERAARPAGLQIWSQMKKSAEAASAAGGGARTVADLARDLWNAHPGALEFHAAGHSAGSIFQVYFLPQLVRPAGRSAGTAPQVHSLHFLAPAATISLFASQLKGLVGPGQPIRSLTVYTMTDELEREDPTTAPYGKSLLYLVCRAFESQVPTPILGLQESLKRDLGSIRFFGLAGRQKTADLLFSPTSPTAGLRDRTASTTHGGFDNDAATMTSVIRRMLDVPDATPIVDYFEDPVEGRDVRAVARSVAKALSPPRPSARAQRGIGAGAGAASKRWTVLVWMAGDNDLESYGLTDIQEMKSVGSSDDLNIVVQLDTMSDDQTRRYFLRHGTSLDADVVERLGETNTGDPAVATDFFAWGIQRYPADRILAVIWNHGSGIDETDVYRRAAARGVRIARDATRTAGAVPRNRVRAMLASRFRRALFSTTLDEGLQDRAIAYDDTSRDFLDNLELQRVLAQVKRATRRTVDLLGFDACLMNMLEIGYQLESSTRLIVGSEEVEPGDGWPYHRILADLAARPRMSAAELGTIVVRRYVASYTDDAVTQSLLDTTAADACAKAVDGLAAALVRALKTPGEFAAITRAMNATQRFDTEDYADLGDFCREIGSRTKDARIKAAAKVVLAAVGRLVVAEAHKGRQMAAATGVAIYLPRGAVSRAYGRLEFARRTRWDQFLRAYRK